MAASAHIKRAFAFRMGYLAAAWLALLVAAPPAPTGAFGALLWALARGLPLAAPLIAWLDWRWLTAHPGAVTRFGFKRRR